MHVSLGPPPIEIHLAARHALYNPRADIARTFQQAQLVRHGSNLNGDTASWPSEKKRKRKFTWIDVGGIALVTMRILCRAQNPLLLGFILKRTSSPSSRVRSKIVALALPHICK